MREENKIEKTNKGKEKDIGERRKERKGKKKKGKRGKNIGEKR